MHSRLEFSILSKRTTYVFKNDSYNFLEKKIFLIQTMIKIVCYTITKVIKKERMVSLLNLYSDIKIVDSIMGSGKTHAAINYINHSVGERFIVITPYLSEVERYKECCKKRDFVEPTIKNKYGTKIEGFKKLLNQRRNIVTTHSLFQNFTDEIIDICRANNYTLIMDESIEVISEHYITPSDITVLKKYYVNIDENTNMLKWKEEKSDYFGVFSKEKKLCSLNSLFYYNEYKTLCLFPSKVFDAFRKIFILTFMFDCQFQKYYFDFLNIPYTYITVKGDSLNNYSFSQEESTNAFIKEHNYKNLIHIINHEKLNSIGDRETGLSKMWFKRNENNSSAMRILKNNISNYYKNIRKTKTSNNIWTTFKDYETLLKGKGYAKGYAPLNARATNDFQDRTSIAYIANRYVNPNIKNFFSQQGITIDEDKYALSEMLQFIWRSAIRNGEEVWVYVPSIRMRRLLEEWVNNGEKPENSSVRRTMRKVSE